jgi:hypothetical protein
LAPAPPTTAPRIMHSGPPAMAGSVCRARFTAGRRWRRRCTGLATTPTRHVAHGSACREMGWRKSGKGVGDGQVGPCLPLGAADEAEGEGQAEKAHLARHGHCHEHPRAALAARVGGRAGRRERREHGSPVRFDAKRGRWQSESAARRYRNRGPGRRTVRTKHEREQYYLLWFE